MARQRLAVVVALLLLLVGCDDPPQPPVTPTPTLAPPARSSAVLPSQGEVDAALLSPAEIPDGPYRVSDKKPGDSAGFNTSLVDCAESAANPDPQVVSTGVYQGPSAVGPFVAETITVTSVSSTTRLMSDLDRVQNNCAAFAGQMPGGIDLAINITPLTMPPIGNATKAFQLTASVPNVGVAVYAHLVVVRTGDVLVQVALVRYTAMTIEETRGLVDLAVNKAARLRSA